jgi:LEA14-like dessication related protein
MPVILILGAVYLILNLMKQQNISIEPVDVAVNLQSGIPKIRVKTRIYNPSKLDLRITQINAVAVSKSIQLGTFFLDKVITLQGESNTFHYFEFKISPAALFNLKQIYSQGDNINITGYAIANGVKVNFTKDVKFT